MTDIEKTQQGIIYEKLMDEIDTGVHAVDSTGKTIIYNVKMSEIENMNAQEVLNKHISEVFKFNEGQESTLENALSKGIESRNVKQTYLNNKGIEITTINNTFPVKQNGTIVGALEVTKDITKLERMVQENMKRGHRKYSFDSIIGRSSEIKEVIDQAKRATRTSSSILIIGETGTGKEIFAQSIHNGSSRSSGPFISQNCAALPDSLIEGILFGTKKGAFTGSEDRPGLFEQAEGGTLLLDEINSLSPNLQSKLLRAIQEKTIRRVGDTKERETDIRLIATMNEDPIDAVTEGRLRKDLYYRLSVVSLFIPPLRDRKDDMKELVDFFMNSYNELFQLNVKEISDGVQRFFQEYHWPGNVREVEHVIEGAMNLITDEEKIEEKHLPRHLRKRLVVEENNNPQKNSKDLMEIHIENCSLKEYLFDKEKAYVKKVLEQNDYHIKKTADTLGLSRQSLQYRLKKLGIKKIRV
ncbi:sigma-54 interaction domain-containing protein [Alteribacillus bidgolensis]|uniref:Arginine utilization regulatory protein n=1 Tax=Alteribacillus bidgolensis TaxID=930129 RepID=A0A1G8KDI4_9BACI|nr:sigma 54-interacting transcriptional regulator [Alteribacillus bidgolensis]SDI41497.1 arginine utilization regulatory protein [Alteribacillus bidgolensis]